MNPRSLPILVALTLAITSVRAQDKQRLPDVSTTFRGHLALPVPLGNPLFNDVTETIGRLGASIQFPLRSGQSRTMGLGGGFDASWFGVKERALSPVITSGEIIRLCWYGKFLYEKYTSEQTFIELGARVGGTTYSFDCATCGDTQRTGLHWGLGFGYFIHASENLAFGFTVGYERDAVRFGAADLGLESFPGRQQVNEVRDHQNLVFGISFSTRFRRTPDSGRGW